MDSTTPRGIGGVGIYFKMSEDGAFVVSDIASSGSAFKEGTVQKNDVLVYVNYENVEGRHLSYIKSLVLGPVGSLISMGFRRPQGNHDFM